MTAHLYTLHLIEQAEEHELLAILDELQTDLQAVREMQQPKLLQEVQTEITVIKNLLNE